MDYIYSGSDNIDEVAWYSDNDHFTHPVGIRKANELGIHDMSGNVLELCSDWYDSTYYSDSPHDNPKGPASGSLRVWRGGGCFIIAPNCRVAYRDSRSPDHCDFGVGFRVVLSAE